jgi:peptide-methionine (S)-S-oxide reductase
MFERIVLGGGCFWGVEAVFDALRGVERALPGYAGGNAATASYEMVSSGQTGHAEVVEVTYDPAVLPLENLLEVYFLIVHNPTEHNRQGPDVGTQYRSAIFHTMEAQRATALAYMEELRRTKRFSQPIVTTCEALQTFYPAEEYHHRYVARNPDNPYVCQADKPKLALLRERYPTLLKTHNARSG